MTLGKSKPKYTWQSLTIWILLVLNNLIKNRFTGKSKDFIHELFISFTYFICMSQLIQWLQTLKDATHETTESYKPFVYETV